MNSQSRVISFLKAPFALWMVVLLFGSYFIFSLDRKKLRDLPPSASVSETIFAYYNALTMSNIKKGIDLEGGTYLV